MRKLFYEFFSTSKHTKLREKVMLTRLTITATIIIMCLAAMNFSAYSYFSYNISSASNIIKSSNFETNVSTIITDNEGNTLDTITPITSDHKLFKIEGLKINEFYTVNIKQIKDYTSSKTGFVIIYADNCPEIYHSQQLGIDENAVGERTDELTFKLKITSSTVVYLQSHWGTSSHYDAYMNKGNNEELYITQGEKIIMSVNVNNQLGVDNEVEPEPQPQPEFSSSQILENEIPSCEESTSNTLSTTTSTQTENETNFIEITSSTMITESDIETN